MDHAGLCVNAGKAPVVRSADGSYDCRAIKTKTVTERDALSDIIARYAKPVLKDGDILFICEKMVACAQGRAFPVDSIRAGRIARMLGGGAVLIVDANDLGVRVLGKSNCKLDESQISLLLRQNPLGQSDESTPMGILRPIW